MISFICPSRNSKGIGRELISSCQNGNGKGPSTKVWSDGIFCPLVTVVMTTHIYKSSQNSISKGINFTICKIHTILNMKEKEDDKSWLQTDENEKLHRLVTS